MNRFLTTLNTLLAISGAAMAALPADSIHRLDDVVVTGSRYATDARYLPSTVTVIDRQTLTMNYQPSILPTLMQQVPGLMLTSRGMFGYGVSTNAAGGLSLRGLSGGSGQMMVLIDGHPQYQGVYGHPISDSYQTMMADRVEVLRGPASVLYGSNAMGGVINIVTRNMHQDGVMTHVNAGAGSYGTVQAEASNQVKAGRLSSTVAANFGRSDNNRPDMGFTQYGGYLKLGYELSAHWQTSVNATVTHFNASNPGTVDEPLYGSRQWITRGEVTAALENHYGRTSGGLSVYSNFGRHKINDGSHDADNPSQRYFRSKDALTGVSLYQSANFFTGNHITLGADWQNIYGRAYYTSIATGEILDTPNKQSGHSHRNEVAAYLSVQQDFEKWLSLNAGVRVDHHSITGTEWIPQAGIVVRPVSTGEFKLSACKGFRNPTMRELYLYPPSNTDLKPERLWSYEASWRQHLLDNCLTYGINAYYIKGDNMIQTVRIDGRPRNVNTGRVENSGVEMDVAWLASAHWSVNTNHSFLHMCNHVLAAPEYKGYLGAQWTDKRWSVNAGLQYISGLFTAVGDDEAKENFWLLNATVACQLAKGLKLWLRGENLLAQQYEINAGFPMPKATFMGGIDLSF